MKISIIFVCFLISSLSVYAQMGDSVMYFRFDETNGQSSINESVGNSDFQLFNHYNFPERILGVNNTGLRLDGWTTYATSSVSIPNVSDEMTIEAWYATEAFAASTDGNRNAKKNAPIISQLSANSGVSLEIGSFGTVEFHFYADGVYYKLQSTKVLSKYQWHHIAATVNLKTQVAFIYVDGVQWSTKAIEQHNALTLSNSTMYIARQMETAEASGFDVTTLNGALDELKIINKYISASDADERYQRTKPLVTDIDLFIDWKDRHGDDPIRPRYHPMPNTNWTNEPYGLTYYMGKYHLFFQKNPNGPYLHFMHWGHLSSVDLVNWTEEKMPFGPSNSFDSFGDWSGTTVMDDNGEPVIFYTSVNTVKASISSAYPMDDNLINWEKLAGPVIASTPSGFFDFRDPFVWKDQGSYYMIVGSGRSNTGGSLPTFKSTDLIKWNQIKTLYTGLEATSGFFWEMPFFQKLNDNNEYILGVNPLFNGNKGAELMYWIGKWENESFKPYFTDPKYMDMTKKNLLATAVGTDAQNRLTYIGIIPETRSTEAQVASGWRQVFSIPRVMRLLEDSTIGHYPHPNLCSYRNNELAISSRILQSGSNTNIPEFSGLQSEFHFTLLADSASIFQLQFAKNTDATKFANVVFDLENNQITFDTRKASSETAGTTNISDRYIFDFKDEIEVTVFLDHSIIEVFVDNLLTFSGRIYPSAQSNLIDLVVTKGQVELVEATQWDMKSQGEEYNSTTCEPTQLPAKFRHDLTVIMDVKKSGKELGSIEVYPNPSTGIVNIKNLSKTNRNIQLYSLEGRLVFENELLTSNDSFDISHIHKGYYVLLMNSKIGREIVKLSLK